MSTMKRKFKDNSKTEIPAKKLKNIKNNNVGFGQQDRNLHTNNNTQRTSVKKYEFKTREDKLKGNMKLNSKSKIVKGENLGEKQKTIVVPTKPQNKDSEKKTKSVKKWKTWHKLEKHKKRKKLKVLKNLQGNIDDKKTLESTDAKRVKIPREISNNWKALQEVLVKDQKMKKPERQKNPDWKEKTIKKPTSVTKSTSPETDSKKVIDIWFDGVDVMLLDIEARKAKRLQEANENKGSQTTINPLVKLGSSDGLTKIVAMDCEMVGVGINGSDSMLARVSLVNKFGQCIYDKFVKPMENVVDYRTFVSGITPDNIKDGEEFFTVQKEVSKIIKGRILVGHALNNDLKVLYLQHDKKFIRDTSKYKGYRSLFGFQTPSLKKLTKEVLGVEIQAGEHDSVQDAQAAMRLYTMYRKQWEKTLKMQKKRRRIRNLQADGEKK